MEGTVEAVCVLFLSFLSPFNLKFLGGFSYKAVTHGETIESRGII